MVQRERKRRYNCELQVDRRWLFCGKKKAGKACMNANLMGGRCKELKISVK